MKATGTYLMVVRAPGRALAAGEFAVESAFAEHLLALRDALRGLFDRIVLVGPEWSVAEHRARAAELRTLSAERDGIAFVPAYPNDASPVAFWGRHARAIGELARGLVAQAGVVHVDLATDIRHPMTAIFAREAQRAGKPWMLVADTDFRLHAERFRATGEWGLARYLFNRHVQDRFRSRLIARGVADADLVLLKSQSLVDDFGRGAAHVKNFYDTVHAPEHVAEGAELAERHTRVRDRAHRLRLCYFGRLVPYKGIDRLIAGVALARDRGHSVTLSVIGDGSERAALMAQAHAAGVDARFDDPLPYGTPLFDRLVEEDLAAATPLVEDTPRAAFDAFARGLPILAFDITYFADLARTSGAVELARWPDTEALAEAIVRLDRDRERLATMIGRTAAFARDNTQALWLERRIAWTRRYALKDTA